MNVLSLHPLGRLLSVSVAVVVSATCDPSSNCLDLLDAATPACTSTIQRTITEIELSLEEVDVVFLILHQFFEQVARDVILDRVAVGRRFLVERARSDFGLQVAVQYLFDILANVQRIEALRSRIAGEMRTMAPMLAGC